MTRIALVTDSTACLPYDLFPENHIYEVPLKVNWGNEESYRDRVEMDVTDFYRRLKTSKVMPATSQPSIGDFYDQFQKLSMNYDAIIAILISSDLSGTVASAKAAAEQCHKVPVHIVDSRYTSLAQGFMVLEAARLAQEGREINGILQFLEDMKPRLLAHFCVDTLEFLRRGGRIGGASAFIGTTLKIHPLLHLAHGRVEALEKVRTKERAIKRLVKSVAERVDIDRPLKIGVVHANDPLEAKRVSVLAQETFKVDSITIGDLSPVLGTHVGPGTVGLLTYQGI